MGPLDRTFLHHVATVVSPTRERRQLVHPVGLENLAAAVNQDRIVVAAQGFVGPLVLPHALDDLRGIQDVSEAEHDGRMRMGLLEGLQRRYQFTPGPSRHVVDQHQVGSEIQERIAEHVRAQADQVPLIDRQSRRLPTARGDLPNRRELDMIHAFGNREKRRDRRISEQEKGAVRRRRQQRAANNGVPPQMTQAQAVLRVDRYAATRAHPSLAGSWTGGGSRSLGANPCRIEQLLDLVQLLPRRRRGRQGAEHELHRRPVECAGGAHRARGQGLRGDDRLAAGRAPGGLVDVPRHTPGGVRYALEAGEARHVDDIRVAAAFHDIDAEQVDPERRPAASRDLHKLRRERARAAVVVGGAGGPDAEHARQLSSDRVDPAVRPVRRMVALGEHRLLDRPKGRELGRVPNHRALPPGAEVRFDDQRTAVQRGEELARMGRNERLGDRHPRQLEHAERHDAVAQQRRDGVGIEQRGAGSVEVRGDAHRQVAPALEHVEVVVQARLRDVEQVVAEIQELRRRAPAYEEPHDLLGVAQVRERPAHQESDPHAAFRPPLAQTQAASLEDVRSIVASRTGGDHRPHIGRKHTERFVQGSNGERRGHDLTPGARRR